MTQSNFEHTVRVYWEDTDAGGVVFFANYLKFFERARTEWLRSLGFSQERMRVDEQAAFVVSETRVRYLRPARLDDLLTITVRIAAMDHDRAASLAGRRVAERRQHPHRLRRHQPVRATAHSRRHHPSHFTEFNTLKP
jgi:acyl-CoA thioester hydrolase